MDINIEPMNEDYARAVAAWRYAEPYAVYGFKPEDAEWLLLPRNCYHAVLASDGELIAFFNVGHDARVPGGNYERPGLDIGLGLRPDLTGKGLGLPLLQAILVFCSERFAPPLFRLTVATFNQRAMQVYRRAGFRELETFKNSRGEYLQMIRDVEPTPPRLKPWACA